MSQEEGNNSNNSSNGVSSNVEWNTDTSTAVRFPVWIGVLILSVLALASHASGTDESNKGTDTKWVLSVTILSMGLSLISVVLYLVQRGLYSGQVPEMVAVGLLASLWGVGLPYIMDPNNGIAVVPGPIVSNANLYFVSWLTLGCVFFLASNLAQESAGYDIRMTPPKVQKWGGFSLAALIIMGSAVRLLKADGCKGDDTIFSSSELCRRTRFAIALGVIGWVFGMCMSFLTLQNISFPLVENIGSTVTFILMTFGLGFITFGNGPGSTISNLFFATWIAFLLAAMIFAQSLKDALGMGSAQEQSDVAAGDSMDLGAVHPAPAPTHIPESLNDDL